VDRFGNLVTNLTRRDVDAILAAFGGDPTEVVVVVEGFVLPLVRTYADVTEGEACAMMGSAQRLEVAVNGGSASRLLGATRGASIRVRSASPERA
jgi:S-adenosylmethionine hydrolase